MSFRWISASFCVVFGIIFLVIRRKSRGISVITNMEKINQAIQEETLKRLGIVISSFFLISLFESSLDILANYLIAVDPDKVNCDLLFIEPNLMMLNPFYHYISRAISNFSAIFVTLYLFWKKWVSKSKRKQHEMNIKHGNAFEVEYHEEESVVAF